MELSQARRLMLIALIAVLPACSFKTLYNQLDYLIPQYVEGKVTLNEMLERQVEQRTLALLQWHRSTQLKEYANWLRMVQRDVGPRLSEATVGQRLSELEQFWRPLSVKVNDEMAALLPLLDEQQQQELFSSIEDDNEEFQEEYVELQEQERIKQYEKRLLENYANWLGTLTDVQILAARQAARSMQTTADLRLQRRIAWQRGIKSILAEEENRTLKTERLRRFLNGFEASNDQAMQEKWTVNRRIMNELTVQIARSLTAEQRMYFMNKTNDYIRMFTELAENR